MINTLNPLSPSQVTTYLDCAARWFYDKLFPPQPATGALAIGRAVHAAIAHALRDPALPHPLDVQAEAVATATAELAVADLRENEDAGQMAIQAGQLAALFIREAAPSIQVAAVELPITGFVGSATARGIIDILTVDGEVIDIKTACRKPEGVSSTNALQLTTYGILAKQNKARVITLTKTKEPAIYSHAFELNAPHTKYTASMFSLVSDAIAHGLHLPNRGSNLCTRKQCAFWRQCQTDYGGVVRD